MTNHTKICIKCNAAKPESDFYFRKCIRQTYPKCKPCYKSEMRIKSAEYRKLNKDKVRAYNSAWQKRRLQDNVEFKIAANLRSRLSKALVRKTKKGSAVRDLGCSVAFLRQHLEAQFQPGMTWENYGEWHIDHIKPLCNFDLTNREELKKATHYSNLQPLWAKENQSKNRYLTP